MKSTRLSFILAALTASLPIAAAAQTPSEPPAMPTPPVVQDNGTITAPTFDLPFSSFASVEARDTFVARRLAPRPAGVSGATVEELRKIADEGMRPAFDDYTARYPYTVTKSQIGNVTVETYIPQSGIAPANKHRVLISIHGGGYSLGGGGIGGGLEAIPIAGEGRIKVIAVDYRLQPEHTMQDAIDDAMTVYRDVLRTYRPENVGVYGCSAGGGLTGMLTTAAIRQALPVPGAIGIFCFPLVGFMGGDSSNLWRNLGYLGGAPSTRQVGEPRELDEFSPTDDELKQFPPTLFLTGTRAFDMSGTVASHLELRSLGVPADLLLFDGMEHGFFLIGSRLPESRRAHQLIARYFTEHLGWLRKTSIESR